MMWYRMLKNVKTSGVEAIDRKSVKFQLIKVIFYSFRLKLLDVVAEAEAELLKVEAEKEVKFI